MNILVTGVCGFVGSNLARRLLNEGHCVTGIDNMSCGFFKNIEDLMLHPGHFSFDAVDIIDYCSNDTSFDAVFHLGARGEVYFCRDHISEAIDVNVKGTLNMLKVAKDSGAKHFYFADTSAQYDSFDAVDIRDYWSNDASFDAVFHLGARGEVYFCRDYIEEAIDINVKGTLNMLKVAKDSGAKHFYFADTSAEYDSFED